jgi:DNA-binding LacI/PurR family transcriptional regulator
LAEALECDVAVAGSECFHAHDAGIPRPVQGPGDCAAGLMAAVRARGVRIPDQLSLVGYDNSHIANLATVALTTIAQDAPALAGKALDLALTRTEHEDGIATETVLPPRLVIRQTSAPLT